MTLEERIAKYELQLQQCQNQIDQVDKQAAVLQNHRSAIVRNYHQAEGALTALKELQAEQTASEVRA
jgi:hypothetical protein